MTLKELCIGINMPEEVTETVLELYKEQDYSALKSASDKLYRRADWEKALEELRNALGKDEKGLKMLTLLLVTGLNTYKLYEEKGISQKIFFDTFQCFSRFVGEHLVSYHTYGFDREWWTPRQISMEEFRLGELEFEVDYWEGERVISVHIPSDAKITRENCLNSYEQALEFFAKYYPDINYRYFICDSWMLSPGLKEVLPPETRILQFQADFTVEEWNKEDPSYMEWVFKNSKLPFDELPEETSLQRNIKRFMKEGGFIGSAFGYIEKTRIL
ncbi:MAG: hypothetical protein K0R05_3070 [Anaerocolumna sp.]|jgi:hypothetical protein|nr:hypothetical protein [Anaerocolumna sp.]